MYQLTVFLEKFVRQRQDSKRFTALLGVAAPKRSRLSRKSLFKNLLEVSLRKVAFPCVTDFTSGKFMQAKFHSKVTENNKNAPIKTLGRLKSSSVSTGKPINEKPSFGHCCASVQQCSA